MLFFENNITRFIFFAILLIYGVTEVVFINSQSITADEGNHLKYGVELIKGKSVKYACTIYDSKMPVSAVNAIPRALQQFLNPGLQKNDNGESDVQMGRYITFLLSFIPLIIVFIWSKELYGVSAGLFSMLLLAVCPNWLAHSGLVTTDAYATTIFLLIFYLLHKYFTSRRFVFFIALCICVGLAQIIKQTFIYLYFCIPLLAIIYGVANQLKFTLKKLLVHGVLLIVISLFIINAGFLFYETGRPLSEYSFVSSFFRGLQQQIPFLASLSLPLPSPYLVGLDTVKFFDEYGGGYTESTHPVNSVLFNNEPKKAYWYFYIVSFIFKTPIPTLIFLVLSLVLIARKRNRKFFLQEELILIVPAFFFFVVMSLFTNIQLGIRHILFVFPLLFVLCGKLIEQWCHFRAFRTTLGLGILLLMISVGYYSNAYLAYTNEFISNKTMAYRIVSISNIDYGQGLYFAQKYIREHPEVTFAPKTPASGTFLISPGDYTDHFNYHEYNWIQKYKPVGHVNFCYLIIEVP